MENMTIDTNILRISIFFVILIILILLESIIPKRKRIKNIYGRWYVNFSLVVISTICIKILFPILAIESALLSKEYGWGFLNIYDFNYIFSILISVCLLDLIVYLQHLTFHENNFLWKFHSLHHSDHDLDASSGLRFHPIEIVISLIIKISFIIFIGVPPMAVIVFEIILNAMSLFNHSNIKIPEKMDKVLRFCIVTPDMHRIHHSENKIETNSNYGFCLSLWDSIFNTYRPNSLIVQEKMNLGLKEFPVLQKQSLIWALKMPFTRKINF